MDRLVEYLSKGQHPIVFEPRTEEYSEIKERLVEMKFVFIKFMDTMGETELGIDVDDNLTNVKEANFEVGSGNIYVVGTCELNFHKVRCIAEINLKTKAGMGYLELLDKNEPINRYIN
jgi:hypothetical protein